MANTLGCAVKLASWYVAFLFATAGAPAQQYLISTYAGGAPPPTPAPAVDLSLRLPQAVASDATGNAYFISSHSVFRLDASGIATRIAGNARAGYSGDGGPATAAQLCLDSTDFPYSGTGDPLPPAIAVDPFGNIYVADNGNFRVRRISPDGIIITVAGDGTSGFSGDGGPATEARLSFILGMAADAAGNLAIADSGNHRVRRVAPDGIIRTVAGSGACAFSGDGGPAARSELCGPTGLAAGTAGDLFVTDSGNNRIRRISSDGTIATAAGSGPEGAPSFYCDSSGDGGPASRASLCRPGNTALDAAGSLFIADTVSDIADETAWQAVRRITPDGLITTVAGGQCPTTGLGLCNFSYFDNTTANKTFLAGPLGLAVDSAGAVLIADPYSSRIRKLTASGTLVTVAGNGTHGYSGDGGAATSAQLFPDGVAVDRIGNVFIADYANDRIRRVSPDGIIGTVAGNGTFGSSGDGGPAIDAELAPNAVAVDGAGNVFAADFANAAIRKISPDGIITTVATGIRATTLAVDSRGGLIIPDTNRMLRISPEGAVATVASPAALAIALDPAGNIFFSEFTRIRRISLDGSVTTVAGNGVKGFSGDGGPAVQAELSAEGIAVDGSGNLFIADTGNNRIRRVSPDGIITTIAGSGAEGYTGDGGPATRASLTSPRALAVDRSGAIYVADSANNAVRILGPITPPHPRVHEPRAW